MTEATDNPVVLVNIFKCDPRHQAELMDHLRVLNEIQRPLKGFISGRLNRGLNGKTVANRAVWASAEDWKAMTRHPKVVGAMMPIMSIATFEPYLYEAGEEILP